MNLALYVWRDGDKMLNSYGLAVTDFRMAALFISEEEANSFISPIDKEVRNQYRLAEVYVRVE